MLKPAKTITVATDCAPGGRTDDVSEQKGTHVADMDVEWASMYLGTDRSIGQHRFADV